MTQILIAISFVLFFVQCERDQKRIIAEKREVKAKNETQPVRSAADRDAADDPAIWVNPENPQKSLVVGCDKNLGISVYDMSGKELSFFPAGEINNVDLRDGFDLNGESIVLVAGSNRTEDSPSQNSICLFKLDTKTGKLASLNDIGIKTNLEDVYGFCLAKDQETKKFYAFINHKSGIIQQWELYATDKGGIDGNLIRSMKVNDQPEGMVVDEELGYLYVGEEDRGVWKFSSKADGDTKGVLVANSTESNPEIAFDIEGLAMYYQPKGKGYLIVSSQGNNSFAIYEREGSNQYLFSFNVVDGDIDGVSDTDGIDITNLFINDDFPNGMLVVQDGRNIEDGERLAQNFKFVDWRDIASLANPPLLQDNKFDPDN
ncbi:phytase [uncultured Draconibacterium sp.]|uniref:phytase n=1 Tax=uncultured Draconibacterium sp. TaxID=1573823 RepID=UPI002AA89784|nr:phytase [uncultured Draconibacterium sp.]